ncbi:hypoxia up-regulated 1-like, partial [Paramuricea clavata]
TCNHSVLVEPRKINSFFMDHLILNIRQVLVFVFESLITVDYTWKRYLRLLFKDDVNDPPTDIRLQADAKLPENSGVNVFISQVEMIDQDSNTRASCRLLNSSNDRVNLISITLVVGPTSTDYESLGSSKSLQILVRCEDQYGASVTRWINLPVEESTKWAKAYLINLLNQLQESMGSRLPQPPGCYGPVLSSEIFIPEIVKYSQTRKFGIFGPSERKHVDVQALDASRDNSDKCRWEMFAIHNFIQLVTYRNILIVIKRAQVKLNLGYIYHICNIYTCVHLLVNNGSTLPLTRCMDRSSRWLGIVLHVQSTTSNTFTEKYTEKYSYKLITVYDCTLLRCIAVQFATLIASPSSLWMENQVLGPQCGLALLNDFTCQEESSGTQWVNHATIIQSVESQLLTYSIGLFKMVRCFSGVILLAILTLYSISYTDGLAVMSVDLGSEFMKIAIVKPGVPMEVALNIESRRKTPLVVSMKDDERLFSDPAMGVAVKSPKSAYRYLHDLIGKKIDNPLVDMYKKRFPFYDIIKDDRGSILFQHDSETKFSVEELLGMVLNNSREIAEKFADQPIKDIIITVPPFFTQAERRAVQRAASMVGLNVLQLMNDNTAAALNFGVFRYNSFNTTEKIYMFYDMGATSTTATIVGFSTTKVKDRGIAETAPQLIVKGVGFDRSLGGREFDFRIRDHLVKLFMEKHKGLDPTTSPRAMSKFLKEAKRVKQVLSANTETFSQIEGAFNDQDFRAKITRAEFEEMSNDLFDRVADPVTQALKSSSVTLDEIDSVLVLGGGFRIPKVQEILLNAVKKSELSKNINADEATAMGAVYQAARLSKGFRVKNFVVKDANVYPIEVTFDRPLKNNKGEETGEFKTVRRTLFHHNNVVPQKKVMTFNKNTDDFKFAVSYGDVTFLTDMQQSMLGSSHLLDVQVKGVAESFKKHETDKTDSKGIKAYFTLDEAGILALEKIESVFEKIPEPEKEEPSTFAKLGSKISSFFTGSSDTDGSKEESKDQETKSEETKDSEKKEDKKSEAESKEDKKEDSGSTKGGEEQKPEEKEGEKASKESQDEEKKNEGNKSEENKSEENKNEEKKDEKTEEQKKEDKKEEGKSDEKKEAKDEKVKNESEKNKTDEKTEKQAPPKPVTIRETLEVQSEIVDLQEMSSDRFTVAVNRLRNMKARDDAKIANARAKNSVESFLFETRDKLSDEEGETLMTEEEREKLETVLSEVSDWLDDEGLDTTEDVYKAKLKKLKEVSKDFYLRISELKNRPQALENLRRSLNLTGTFLKQIAGMKEKDEIFTNKDLEDVWKVLNETIEWLYTTEKKQNATKPSENPVLLVKDIIQKTGKLDRELMYLLNKAKYYVPKTKPADNSTSTNGTDSSSEAKPEDKTKENKTMEDKTKEDKTKEDTTKEDTTKEDTTKDDTIKEDKTKEDTTKEDTTKEDTTKEDTTKEDTTKSADNSEKKEKTDDKEDKQRESKEETISSDKESEDSQETKSEASQETESEEKAKDTEKTVDNKEDTTTESSDKHKEL